MFAIKLRGKLPQTSQLLCFFFVFVLFFLSFSRKTLTGWEKRMFGTFGQIKKLKCLAKDYQLKRIITVFKNLVQSDALHSSQEFEEYFSERKIDADQSSFY